MEKGGKRQTNITNTDKIKINLETGRRSDRTISRKLTDTKKSLKYNTTITRDKKTSFKFEIVTVIMDKKINNLNIKKVTDLRTNLYC